MSNGREDFPVCDNCGSTNWNWIINKKGYREYPACSECGHWLWYDKHTSDCKCGAKAGNPEWMIMDDRTGEMLGCSECCDQIEWW